MADLPPMFGHAPGLGCSRWLGDRHCGAPAKWHVIWTPECDNGLCCDEHMAEARQRWVFYAAHPYDPVCSIAGAVLIHAENRCAVLDDGLLVAEVEEARRG